MFPVSPRVPAVDTAALSPPHRPCAPLPRSSISNLWPAGRPVIPSPHPTTVVIYHPPPHSTRFSGHYAAPGSPSPTTQKPLQKLSPPPHALTLCARECLCFAFCLFAFSLSFSITLSFSLFLSRSLAHVVYPPVHARSHTYIISASAPVKRKATGTESGIFSPLFSLFRETTTMHTHTHALQCMYTVHLLLFAK